MKVFSSLRTVCALIAIAILASACSRKDAPDRAELLGLASSDCKLVACIDYSAILANAGEAADMSGFHDRDAAVFRALSRADGLLLDNVLVLGRKGGDPEGLMVVGIADDDALRKSLTPGCDVETSHGVTCYTPSAYGDCLVSDGRLLWILPRASAGEQARRIDRVRKHAENMPLSEAVMTRFSEYAGHTAVAFAKGISTPYASADSLCCLLTAQLDGRTLHIDYMNTDANASARPFMSTPSLPLGAVAGLLSADDLIAFAAALPEDFDYKYIAGLVAPDYLDDENIVKALHCFDGRVAFGGTLADVTTTDYTDLDQYRIAFALGAKDGKAPEMLTAIADAAAARLPLPLTRRGDAYYLAGFGLSLRLSAEGDFVVLATDKASAGARVQAQVLDGCLAWASVNIPSDLAALKYINVKFGLRAEMKVTQDAAAIDVTFTDTEMTFTQCLLKLLKTFG